MSCLETLYRKALEGDKDCGGLLAYNYFSGEPVTGLNEGRPLFVRRPDASFYTGKLYEKPSLCITCHVKDRSGYPVKRGKK